MACGRIRDVRGAPIDHQTHSMPIPWRFAPSHKAMIASTGKGYGAGPG
jgi:hypothetical protein